MTAVVRQNALVEFLNVLWGHFQQLQVQWFEVRNDSCLDHAGVALVGSRSQRGTGTGQPLLNIVGEGKQRIRMGVLRQFRPFRFLFQSFFLAPLEFTPDLLKRLLRLAITGTTDG